MPQTPRHEFKKTNQAIENDENHQNFHKKQHFFTFFSIERLSHQKMISLDFVKIQTRSKFYRIKNV